MNTDLIIENLCNDAKELGFEIEPDDIYFDGSRAYALYIYGSTIDEPCYKFGAWRNYHGGGLREPIQNSSIYATDENVKALARLFEKALRDIESLDDYEDYAEHMD